MPVFSRINERDVDNGISQRIKTPALINQSSTPLCGMACIANVLATHDKEGYKNIIKDLYYYGKTYYNKTGYCINPYNATAKNVWEKGPNDSNYPKDNDGKMPVCDYILLSSLKSNIGLIPYSGNLNETSFLEMNLPKYIVTYSKDLLGLKQVVDNTNILNSGGDFNALRTIDGLFKNGYDVFLLINADMLEEKKTGSNIPSHWVLYKGNLSINEKTNSATFKVFSWGIKDLKTVSINENLFYKDYYGYIKGKW